MTAAAIPGRIPGELRSRHLLVRVAEITAVIAVVGLAITALPGLNEVRGRLQGVDPVWIVALVVAEIASCGGYVLVFRSTFCSQMSWGLSYDIAMAELAANSLLAGRRRRGSRARRLGAAPGRDAHRSHRAAHGRVLHPHERRELPRARSCGDRRVHRDRGRPRVGGADACSCPDRGPGHTAGRVQSEAVAGAGAAWRGRRPRSLARARRAWLCAAGWARPPTASMRRSRCCARTASVSSSARSPTWRSTSPHSGSVLQPLDRRRPSACSCSAT